MALIVLSELSLPCHRAGDGGVTSIKILSTLQYLFVLKNQAILCLMALIAAESRGKSACLLLLRPTLIIAGLSTTTMSKDLPLPLCLMALVISFKLL
jgi:hypothetical protein